ncbi:MAG: right-handed parallel beta-helix repeat-containing protein [Paramuribaculum sp.]|nr:right-handed parallel beta-helix repeat-containing protein [Paramuribaculum sp.]
MTKKFLFGTMAVALMMATACTSEMDVVAPTGDEAMVAVSVDVPQLQMNSRAFSDGMKATTLQGALYEVTGSGTTKTVKLVNVLDTDENFQLKKTVSLKLRTGNTYALIFWADASKSDSQDKQSPYTVTFEQTGAKMEADYKVTEEGRLFSAGDDKLDAFYCYEEFTVAGDMAVEAKLYRPFAQINIGTNDLDADAIAEKATISSTLTAHNVYKSMDLVTGFVTGEPTDVGLQNTSIPQNEEFPVKGYEYLTMGYFLVGQTKADDPEKSLIDVEFIIDITGEPTLDRRNVSNVPVQRNYRTNIYGQFITSNVIDNVEIIPGYDGTTEPGYEYTDLDLLADKGGELTLTSDIEIDHDINVINDGVLHLNGFTVTGKNGAKLTIGEKVVSKAGGEPAKLRIEGNGTVSTPLVVDGGELTIAGGYYAEIAGAESTITVESGKLIIEGGVFNGENVIGGDGVTTENVTIEGGTFKDFDPEEFVPAEKKDDVVTLPEGTTIVTAANAISAITAGGDILLIEDVILSDRIVSQKSTTIDLGGNSITSNVSGKDAMVITGNSNAEVTIKNGTFKSNGQNDSYGIIAVQKDPKVTIEDVNLEGINPIMMYSTGAGTITINSGTFIGTGAQAVYYFKGSGKIIINGGFFKSEPYKGIYYTLNIYDPNRPASGDVRDAIEVRGGTFVNFDPSNNKAEGEGTNFVANGYKVISEQVGSDIYYTVVPN